MPIFGGQSYTPKGARGVGGGWWVNTSRNARRGSRFRVTWDQGSGFVYHDYGGGRRVRVARIGGAPNAPRAPSVPRVPQAGSPNAPKGPPVPGAAGTPNYPAGPTVPAATGPNAPGTAGGGKPGAPAPKGPAAARYADDSQAVQERAQLRFQTAQKLAELAQQGAYDRADLTENLRRQGIQQGLDTQRTRENANRAGLFYSGQLGKQQDQLAARYVQSRFDQQQRFDRSDAARAAARAALQEGASLEEAAISARNVDRQVQRDTGAADARTLVPETGPQVKPASQGAGGNSAVRALSRFGAIRARGIGGGLWRVRFKSGALRTLRLRNGRWEIFRANGWQPFR